MTAQQQEQQTKAHATRGKRGHLPSRRGLIIITVLLLAIAIIITWILSYLRVIPGFWASIFTIIITVLGAVFAFFQSMHVFIPVNEHRSPENSFIVQIPSTQLLAPAPPLLEKASYRGIIGLPPPTDPRTIQQREQVVSEVYAKLIQPDITAIALTGIGGVGKSTLAALISRYAENQRQTSTSPFPAQAIWLSIDSAVTFIDLSGNLFEALGKPLPDLSNLAPHNQAVALFNALNTTDKPRLIILDQFENLLDRNSGHALTDRPGVGERLDVINSQPCICRILLTSRPRPVGTREYPPTYLQKYLTSGLTLDEGVKLLRNRGVQGTSAELQTAVTHCAGHTFSLMLLASLVQNHQIGLARLFENPALWTGDIVINILDQIYTHQLTEVQQDLLLPFSVYREPISLDAALAVVSNPSKVQVQLALKALLTQHLIDAAGDGRYQLHAIIADYVRRQINESREQSDRISLKMAHARAAQYCLEQAAKKCPPREKRRKISDVQLLIEAVWHLCHAEEWKEACNLMQQERIFSDLRLWGGHAILLELCQLLLPLNKWHPERPEEAMIYSNLTSVYQVLGKPEQALKYHEQALSIFQETGDRTGQASMLNGLGWVFDDYGKPEEALKYYEQALSIFQETDDRIGQGRSLNGIAWIYRGLGKHEEALKYYEQSLSIRREEADQAGVGTTLNCLGLTYADLGKHEEALKYYEESLKIRKEVGDRSGEGRTLNSLGLAYAAIGNRARAREYFKQSLSVRREVGDRVGEGKTLYNIGKLYFHLGQFNVTLASFLLAGKIFEEVQNPDYNATEKWINTLHQQLGDERFTDLLTIIEQQAQQVVDQALSDCLP